jgi:enabled protein
MCKYTIYNLECGHPAEDHVVTGDCSHFEKIGVPCDRENTANRDRVSVKSENRDGLCNKCRRRQRDMSELEAIGREEEERAKEQSLVEAKEREAALKEHEENLYRESKEEFSRLQQEREQADIEYMLQKSREEAEVLREQKEQDELARALQASCVLDPADRNVTLNRKVSF